MSGFITWLFNTIYGPQSADINRLAQTMYDAFQYEDQRIDEVNQSVWQFENITNQEQIRQWNMLLDIMNVMFGMLTAIIVVNIANLRQYVDNRIDSLSSSISSRFDWFMTVVNLLVFGLRLLIFGVKDWVEASVAGPLWAALNAFIRWATGEIRTLLQYILHPELLVKLIAGYLWQAWVHLLHIFAVPIARYIIRTMFALKDEFVGIIIDVLAEII